MSAQRIQLRRTPGWRKPDGAVVVARPSKWGNPFTIEMAQEIWFNYGATDEEARAFVVECFRDWLYKGDLSEWWYLNGAEQHAWMRTHLRDIDERDLACWCPLDQPCHADVLLEAAAV
jgi:hypothetical protein